MRQDYTYKINLRKAVSENSINSNISLLNPLEICEIE